MAIAGASAVALRGDWPRPMEVALDPRLHGNLASLLGCTEFAIAAAMRRLGPHFANGVKLLYATGGQAGVFAIAEITSGKSIGTLRSSAGNRFIALCGPASLRDAARGMRGLRLSEGCSLGQVAVGIYLKGFAKLGLIAAGSGSRLLPAQLGFGAIHEV